VISYSRTSFVQTCKLSFSFFFFGGLSIPLSQAILAHLVSYNITWSATVKEVQRSNFFKEIPKILKRSDPPVPLIRSRLIALQILVFFASVIDTPGRHRYLCHESCASRVASKRIGMGHYIASLVRCSILTYSQAELTLPIALMQRVTFSFL
jgi:hypothetical protein